MDNCARRFLESTQFVVKVGVAGGGGGGAAPAGVCCSLVGGSCVDLSVDSAVMSIFFISPASWLQYYQSKAKANQGSDF